MFIRNQQGFTPRFCAGRHKGAGFTIMELLIVMAILSLAASMSAISYNNWQNHVQLINAKDEIRSALIRTQQLATAAAKENSWGVHFTTSTYTMFKGNFYNESDPDNYTWTITSANIVTPYALLSDGAGGYGPDVVFAKFTGLTSNTGTISIISPSDPMAIKTISIQSAGKID
ncbi:prepilin-type N-terminal cleavage/methylation domain-containing protein [bacterium]|nr:prepilin-type N-terminal cleavage/methylation domain-containing protein [bacterium]